MSGVGLNVIDWVAFSNLTFGFARLCVVVGLLYSESRWWRMAGRPGACHSRHDFQSTTSCVFQRSHTGTHV